MTSVSSFYAHFSGMSRCNCPVGIYQVPSSPAFMSFRLPFLAFPQNEIWKFQGIKISYSPEKWNCGTSEIHNVKNGITVLIFRHSGDFCFKKSRKLPKTGKNGQKGDGQHISDCQKRQISDRNFSIIDKINSYFDIFCKKLSLKNSILCDTVHNFCKYWRI